MTIPNKTIDQNKARKLAPTVSTRTLSLLNNFTERNIRRVLINRKKRNGRNTLRFIPREPCPCMKR